MALVSSSEEDREIVRAWYHDLVYDYPYVKKVDKQMFVLVDSEGNIKGRFDHLMQGEKLANDIEQVRGHGKLEWVGMRNFNEGYGTNGVNFYRMLEDTQCYYVVDRFNKYHIDPFKTLDKAVSYINSHLIKNKTQPIAFTELKPGFWYGHNAPAAPDIIKDLPVSTMDGKSFKYDYFEINREYKYEGKTKV